MIEVTMTETEALALLAELRTIRNAPHITSLVKIIEPLVGTVPEKPFRVRYHLPNNGSRYWNYFKDPFDSRRHARYATREDAQAAMDRMPKLPRERREITDDREKA